MNKETAIKKEIDKLNSIFEDIPEDKKSLCEGLIKNAAFMYITLEELQDEINDKGAMIKYQSGNGFDTIRDNPAQKAYTTMISRYSGIIEQLNKLLPSDKSIQNNDELLDFLKNN